MKNIFQIVFKNNESSKTKSFFFVVGFLLLYNMSAFCQIKENTVLANNTLKIEVTVALNNTELNKANEAKEAQADTMNFLNWFMGTKQSPSSSDQEQTNTTNAKAKIIQSGITPNRVLMKTFLKKAMNINVAYA
jgi:recombinational DNA repair protein (RecF pathway)